MKMLYLTKWEEYAMADEIYTVAQASQYLQVCEKTVRRLISSNRLIAYRVGNGNRSLRIKKSDIDSYLEEHTNNTKGAAINE